ncbi:MAG TPA: hypothetical protein VOA87_06285, partial [Thermoanaerobaculia bacterium]|nr:hypothetical protein [Thermoanaerobaculia bacterium]
MALIAPIAPIVMIGAILLGCAFAGLRADYDRSWQEDLPVQPPDLAPLETAVAAQLAAAHRRLADL